MFIKTHDDEVVALNLNAYDAVEIQLRKGKSLLMLSKKLTSEKSAKTIIQSYSSDELAMTDFQSMMLALETGKRVWTPSDEE